MFESDELPTEGVIAELDDSGLIDAIDGALRLERVATARRIFAIGELFLRREAALDDEDRANWRIDGWDVLAAEVACAQGITRQKAAAQIQLATTLREELPRIGGVFAAGLVDYWVVSLIASRLLLVDAADVARIDAALARQVHRWNRLSKKKVIEKVDSWVVTVDALAKRRSRTAEEGRHIEFIPQNDGVVEVSGSLSATDAAAFEARVDAVADTVCCDDPRTKQQRRADATGAIGAGMDRLACRCDREGCAAGVAPTSNVVVHVVADAATVHGDAPIPGYVPGYGALPAELVRALVRTAKVRPVAHPGTPKCEAGYRPSTALAEFVRCRDLTCRFPGCDAPAEVCDLDHTVPWPDGPTHPSNLKLLCRHHHLMKTFHRSWRDVQQPDGTVVWTSPSGHTYATEPGGVLYFPQVAKPTGKLLLPNDIPPGNPSRGVAMPKRSRTRAADRQARIAYERGLNLKDFQALPPPEPEPPPPF
jgi:Domain of unknown function (DUF222)